jgi:hypothetical protein
LKSINYSYSRNKSCENKEKKEKKEKRMSLSTVDLRSGTVRTSDNGEFHYSMKIGDDTKCLIISNFNTDPYVELSNILMEQRVRYCTVNHIPSLDDNGNKYYFIYLSNDVRCGNENNYFLLVNNESEDLFRIVKRQISSFNLEQ